MKLSLIAFAALAAASKNHPENEINENKDVEGRPSHESNVKHGAALARTLLFKERNLHLNTIDRNTGAPVSFVEYFVGSDDCPDVEVSNNGNVILLLLEMSSSYQNLINGSAVSASVEGHFGHKSPMSSPRANYFGNLKALENSDSLKECFLSKHPDARWWLPGDDKSKVHDGHWYELDVNDVYIIGGFGDRSYIGPVSNEEYHGIFDKPPKSLKDHAKPHPHDRVLCSTSDDEITCEEVPRFEHDDDIPDSHSSFEFKHHRGNRHGGEDDEETDSNKPHDKGFKGKGGPRFRHGRKGENRDEENSERHADDIEAKEHRGPRAHGRGKPGRKEGGRRMKDVQKEEQSSENDEFDHESRRNPDLRPSEVESDDSEHHGEYKNQKDKPKAHGRKAGCNQSAKKNKQEKSEKAEKPEFDDDFDHKSRPGHDSKESELDMKDSKHAGRKGTHEKHENSDEAHHEKAGRKHAGRKGNHEEHEDSDFEKDDFDSESDFFDHEKGGMIEMPIVGVWSDFKQFFVRIFNTY